MSTMDTVTKKLLNDFSKSQPALNVPGKPAEISGIKLGDIIESSGSGSSASFSSIESEIYTVDVFPKILLPSPGSMKFYVVEWIWYTVQVNFIPNTSANTSINFNNGLSQASQIIPTPSINTLATTRRSLEKNPMYTTTSGNPLFLSYLGNPLNGDSTIFFKMAYKIITLI